MAKQLVCNHSCATFVYLPAAENEKWSTQTHTSLYLAQDEVWTNSNVDL